MNLIVNERFKALLPKLTEDEYRLLEESILTDGCRDPLVIWKDQIVDGHNRFGICARHGLCFDVVEMDFADEDAAMDWIDRNQLGRRNLDAKWIEYVQGRRYNREKKAKGGRSDRDFSGGNDCHPKTAERHAQEYGVSEKTVRNAGKFAAAVDAKLEDDGIKNPTVDDVLTAAERVKEQIREAKRQEQVQKAEEIVKNNADLPDQKKYCVIYADPPWRYRHSISLSRDIENQYPTMDLEEIAALPVPQICSLDTVLFLWATPPKLEEALFIVRSWGFEYKTCAVWDKEKIGMGYWFRQQHELLLVATRGNPVLPKPEQRISSMIREPRTDHSRKPDSVRKYLEAAYPTMPKIELFARSRNGNWDVWGNQAAQLSAEPGLFQVNVGSEDLGGNLQESVP